MGREGGTAFGGGARSARGRGCGGRRAAGGVGGRGAAGGIGARGPGCACRREGAQEVV